MDKRSRDLTAFYTPLRLLQQTTLSIGAINSIAQFVQIVTKILKDLILYNYILFFNNIGVKGLTIIYNKKEVLLGVCRFIIEHI